eukprot:Hpha_TRINITY_DN23223_c0_g1::TRINITY_DN23223_c0_g1_i1::g.30211::m.30211
MAKCTLGMLCWEGDQEGRALDLDALESLVGNVTNPQTFPFPILKRRCKHCCWKTIVASPDDESALQSMVAEAQALEAEGVRAIFTSCGFNATRQEALRNAVRVPVFTSALMLIPLLRCSLGVKNKKVAVITASAAHLTAQHLRAVGVEEEEVVITGVGDVVGSQFHSVLHDPSHQLDPDKFIAEIVAAAKETVEREEEVGSVLLECTDLPPAAAAIRVATTLPVYDITTLVTMVHSAL